MNGDLADLSTADLLNLEAMDWDAPSVLDVGNHHNPVDLSNPLLSSDLMNELATSAANDSALAWHSEHGLLDDLNALASTDMFPSHSGRNADQQEENVIEDAPQGSQRGGSQAFKKQSISSAPAEEASDGEHDDAGGDASENESQTPKGMMVTSTPVVERRATREKAHVNYKALLNGPSITRKLVPPKKPAHNDKGQRVYCSCRQPDKGNFMIQCDNCEEWFHGSCVGLTKKVGEKLTTFHCEACKALRGLPTTQPSTTPTATKSAAQTAAKQPRRHSTGRTTPAAAAASKASLSASTPAAAAASPATQRTPHARSKGRKLDMQPQPPAKITKCLHVNCSNPPSTTDSAAAKPGFCSAACYDAERHRLTNLAAELAASALSNPKSPTYPPKKCEHRPCTNARAAGSVFCGAACVAWCPPDPKMVAMLAASGVVQAPRLPQPPPPVALDKYRQNALNGFVTTFEKIFQEARETPALYGLDVPPVKGEEDEGQRVNLNDVKGFCAKLESALFASWSSVRKGDRNNTKEVGEPYKAKYRSLQFNLNDVENVRLRRDVLKGTTTPSELVNLSSEELGNDAVRATIEAVRRKSLRDSVRAAEHHEHSGTGFVKKTHKGEVEVVPVGAEDNDAVWGAHPVSMFGGWQDRDVVQSPRTDEPPLSALSEKREGGAEEEEEEGPKAKKVKFDSVDDNNAENAMDGVSHGRAVAVENAAGVEADGSGASVPLQVMKEESQEVEEPAADLVLEGDAAADHYGYEEYEPIDARAQTPPGSPPLPAEPIDPSAPIWTGRVHMPVVGRFQGQAIQTHGLLIGTARTWEDLLPATVTIDGRVPPSAVEKYLEQSRTIGGRQVVAVRFEPAESEEDRAGYATVFEYFASRTRAAVIGHHYVSIKDMYILPVAAGAAIPTFIAGLGGLGDAEGMEIAERDSLFGVIILCKGFGSPAMHPQSPLRDRKREPQPLHLQNRQTSPPPQRATEVRQSTQIPSMPPPPFPAAGTPSRPLPTFPAAAPSLLDAFAGPLNPNTGASAANTASMLSSLLANPANAGMLSGLLAQLGSSNSPGGAPPVDLAALLSTMQGTNMPLPGVAPAPAAQAPVPGIDPRMHPSRAAHAMMQDPQDQYHAGRQQDGPPGKKTRWG
ncbi:PHD finger protein 3 [Geranomyces variabilis]|uniref:Transcription factor BYE1 n=1 Tax=Geranomyces variabilis TaxID=109894 RepID=A0AAD5TQS2_9FUNG|nr:PHD finger protein 3 [Geranomyces variabilis]